MVTTTLEIKASAKQIWDALTKEENQKKWYFDIPEFNAAIGSTFDFYESEAKEFLHRCVVLNSIENKIFQHTWTHPNESKGTSIVTWEIEEENGLSTVTLTHTGLESFADGGDKFKPENYQTGWDAIVKTNLRNFLVGIERLVFPIEINAPANVVWEKMWSLENYKIWTVPFCEGSYFKGELKQGERIHFLAPDGSGMYSNVFFIEEPKNVVFQHIGELQNFEEQPLDDAAKSWTGCFEIYKLEEIEPNKIKLTVEMDCVKEHIKYMSEKFPLGLEIVKQISEKSINQELWQV